ncbi:hypothetical protein Vafri_10451, partial [Volvox africanus]
PSLPPDVAAAAEPDAGATVAPLPLVGTWADFFFPSSFATAASSEVAGGAGGAGRLAGGGWVLAGCRGSYEPATWKVSRTLASCGRGCPAMTTAHLPYTSLTDKLSDDGDVGA